MNAPIPVTILTGFLWSGKTTLLNHLLREFPDKKIAIVENEFGSEGIDGDLIETSREEIVEINSGCICCVVRKDFIDAIERLLSSGRHIDWIVIEASWMSEPLPIAQSFLMQDLGGRIRLDSIVCMVDAPNLTAKLMEDMKTVVEQLEFADMVVVNKTDLVPPEYLRTISDVIRRVNYYGAIVETAHWRVDGRLLFDTGRFEVTDDLWKALEKHETEGHAHDSSVTSFVYSNDKPFDELKLSLFFEELDQDVYRVKGFLKIAGKEGRFLIQKAWARLTTVRDESPNAAHDGRTKIVFIGKSMDHAKLWSLLDGCTDSPSVLFTAR